MNSSCNPILAALLAPFSPERVSWRVGSTTNAKDRGMALAYIDARDVMERLDAVFGVNWQCRYSHAEAKTVCEIGVLIGDQWLWRADGAGDSDVEAEKGALSDAFKRAAVKWGIGRYLYDLDSPWVKITQKGRSYVIDESELERLQKLLPGSKAVTARAAVDETDGDPTRSKNPPGRHKVVTGVRDFDREIRSCTDGDQLLALINTKEFKRDAFKVCCEFPNDWLGAEDNSGLSCCLAQKGDQLGCHHDIHNWISRMERERDARKTKQAAE